MSRRRKLAPRRAIPRWAVMTVAAAAIVAAVVIGRTWFRGTSPPPPTLEPMPTLSLAVAGREVAAVLEIARQHVERNPNSAAAWGDLATALRAHDFGPEAEPCFRNAERLDSANYRWPYLLSISLAANDQPQSLAALRRAAERAGPRLHVHLRLADMLLSQNQVAEASQVVEHVLQLDPSSPRAQLIKAQVLLAQDRLGESREWCQRSIAGASDQRASLLLMAQLCRRLGDEEGVQHATKALEPIPDGFTDWDDPDVTAILSRRRDPYWLLMSAGPLAAEGRTQEALEMMADVASDSDPAYQATEMLVQALMAQQRPAQAETILREKLLQDPHSERLHFRLGVLFYSLGKFDAAADEFRRATQLKSDYVDAHYNLGHSLRKSGRNQDALVVFATTVRLSPGHAFARANLAELLLDSGCDAEARTHLQVAARLAPNDPKVCELLVRLPVTQPLDVPEP